MSQFAQLYTAATAEAVATINDELTYRERCYPCILAEETYSNALGEGGFEPTRGTTATVPLAGAPIFKMGDRVKVNGRSYRITGIDTDVASIDITLSSPEAR